MTSKKPYAQKLPYLKLALINLQTGLVAVCSLGFSFSSVFISFFLSSQLISTSLTLVFLVFMICLSFRPSTIPSLILFFFFFLSFPSSSLRILFSNCPFCLLSFLSPFFHSFSGSFLSFLSFSSLYFSLSSSSSLLSYLFIRSFFPTFSIFCISFFPHLFCVRSLLVLLSFLLSIFTSCAAGGPSLR